MRGSLIDVMPWLRSIRPVLTLVDPVAVLVAGLVVRDSVSPLAVIVAAVAAALVCRGSDLHRSRLVLSVLEDLPRLALATLVATVTLVAITPTPDLESPSWAMLVTFSGTTLALLVVLRAIVYSRACARRRDGRSSHPAIIVGSGAVGQRLARTFLARGEYGLHPVGMIDTVPGLAARDLPLPLLGGVDDLENAMADLGVDDVVFAFPEPPDADTLAIVRRCVQRDHQVFVVPRFFEMMGLDHRRRTEVIGDVAVMRLRRWGVRPHTMLLKRAFDVTLAGLALILLSPVLLACALAVRLETGPGVIFRQVRVGLGGGTFTLYKFRSLRPTDQQESATQWSIDNDDRLGPVGRFLRRTSLDELPQLVNVLRGDMSLVGPRPERPFFVREFSRAELRYDDRHRVPTGLTGWAQVNDLRGDTPIDARVRFDNHYIENWSFWTDVKIMARTVRAVFRAQPGGDRALELAPVEAAKPRRRARAGTTTPSSEAPRILHVSMPTTEGVAGVVVGYVRDQVARGWAVTVACPSDGWLGARAREAGAQVIAWEATRNPGPRLPRELRALRRVVAETRPDVVHLHSAKAGLVGRLVVRERVPTLFQPHAWSFLAVTGPMRWVTRTWERFGQRWTTELVCVSRGEREAGEAAGISAAVSVTPNGVDLDHFLPVQDRERRAARQRLGLEDAPTVVCVGRLAPQKGQRDLLDAWGEVRRQVPTARLVLVGDGPDRDVLIERASQESGVSLAGARPDVTTWLAAADVVVAPSHWEGMAIAPLEAMASARSVVATTAAGMTDSVPPGAGSLVEVGDLDDLAHRLVERLLDPVLASTEGATGRAHVEAHHDVNASTRDVARVSLRLYRRAQGTADVLAALEPMPLSTQITAKSA